MTDEIRSNIYKIVDNTRTPDDVTQPRSLQRKPSNKERIKPYLKGYIRGMRWLAYYLLMWIRPLFQLLAKIVAVPAMLLGLIGFGIGDQKHAHVPYILLAVSFGAFLIGWLYDSLLLAIAPEPVSLM